MNATFNTPTQAKSSKVESRAVYLLSKAVNIEQFNKIQVALVNSKYVLSSLTVTDSFLLKKYMTEFAREYKKK